MSDKILIVEDQFVEANNLQMIFERAGYTVCGIARSVPVALRMMEKQTPDLVLLDIFLQGSQTGIELAKSLNEKNIAFIYLSANSNKETLEAAKATSPYGFLVKPVRERDVLVMLEIARYLHEEKKQRRPLHNNPGNTNLIESGNFYGIVGKSKQLQTVLDEVQLVAPADSSVIIMGETGTGKERIAECIHALSARHAKPLVKVNCAAMPATLVESMLFGHEKGAYTGALERRTGKFELADKGTIFLDEIGELSLDLQSKLLRALQEKEIERLGSNDSIKVDVRVIAATNRNLEKEIAEGRFRMDLYYRLHVFPLNIPPLRERKEDIPMLTRYFIDYYAKKLGKSAPAVTAAAMDQLLAWHWPGNIRELEHVIERAVLLAREKDIHSFMLPSVSTGENEWNVKTMEENERAHIINVLKKCGGKIFGKDGAAELLGINASTLNSRIKKLGINKSTIIF